MLEGEVARLRIEKVDDRNETEVEYYNIISLTGHRACRGCSHTGKIDIRSVSDIRDTHRSDFHHEECENPYFVSPS